MTNEELEEKVKETFESIMDSIKSLGEKEKSFSPLQMLLVCVLLNVLDVYKRTPIYVDEKDIKHKWTYIAYKISKLAISTPPIIQNRCEEPISLQEAYNYLKQTDDNLKNGDNLMKIVNELKEQENDK